MRRLLRLVFGSAVVVLLFFLAPAAPVWGACTEPAGQYGIVLDRVKGTPANSTWATTTWNGLVGGYRDNLERDLAVMASMGMKQVTILVQPCASGLNMSFSTPPCADPASGCDAHDRVQSDVDQAIANLTGTAQGTATVPPIGVIPLIKSFGMRTILALGIQRVYRYGCSYPNFDRWPRNTSFGWDVVYGDSAAGWNYMTADLVWWVDKIVTAVEASPSASDVIYDVGDEIWYGAPYPPEHPSYTSASPDPKIRQLMQAVMGISSLPASKTAVRLLKSCDAANLKLDSDAASFVPQYVGHNVYAYSSPPYDVDNDYGCGWSKVDLPAAFYATALSFPNSCSYLGEYSMKPCEEGTTHWSEGATAWYDKALQTNAATAGVNILQQWRLWSNPGSDPGPGCKPAQEQHGLTDGIDAPHSKYANYITSDHSLWSNGDFESDSTGWYVFGGVAPALIRKEAHLFGAAATNARWLRMKNSGGATSLCSPKFSVTPGDRVAVAGYLRSSRSEVTLQLRWVGGSQVDYIFDDVKSGQWSQIEYLGAGVPFRSNNVPAGISEARICFWAQAANVGCASSVWVDIDAMSVNTYTPG